MKKVIDHKYDTLFLGFPGGSEVKVSASNVGDLGSILGLERFHMPWSIYAHTL